MQIIHYTNTITDHSNDSRTVQHNNVLVETEAKGIRLLENWNQNARNNARNFNRTNPYRYDFVSSRPATKEEIQSMDLYAPVETYAEERERIQKETNKKVAGVPNPADWA